MLLKTLRWILLSTLIILITTGCACTPEETENHL